ncbi:hypothetical protein [Streptomyces sp. NPDC014894]|uniref:hypothetical protein n=1 Tax=Streptomyces sp. NPDC014894 TaxID=3364931 RepID=UPI0036FCCE43
MVVDHAEARAELRRAAEATDRTIALLKNHGELQQFLAPLRSPAATPAVRQPPPRRAR